VSFEVKHFRINEKPPRDCISLYNNAGLISKVSEEIYELAKTLKIAVVDDSTLVSRPFHGIREYPHKPYIFRK